MKIEAGKYYRTRDGRKVGPMVSGPRHSVWPWRIISDDCRDAWNDEGSWTGDASCEHDEDLISEWLTPHQQRTADMIKVMQAYVDGGNIQVASALLETGYMSASEPCWDWKAYDYRIAPATTPDTIDWSHVAPEFKWMARDSEGQCWLYHTEPKSECCSWYSMDDVTPADSFSSYHRGTCDWKDSLVKRPE